MVGSNQGEEVIGEVQRTHLLLPRRNIPHTTEKQATVDKHKGEGGAGGAGGGGDGERI